MAKTAFFCLMALMVLVAGCSEAGDSSENSYQNEIRDESQIYAAVISQVEITLLTGGRTRIISF